VVDLHTDLQTDIPHIQVRPGLSKAAAATGLKPGDIPPERRHAGVGDEVSDIHRNNKVYDIMVWSTPKTRRNVADIRNMLLDTHRPGGHVRMKEDVADVRILPTPNQIEREQDSRRKSTWRGRSRDGAWARWSTRSRTGWGTSRSPASTTRGAGRVPGAGGGAEPDLQLRAGPRRSASSSCCRPASATSGSLRWPS
jgi:hypothetical protein